MLTKQLLSLFFVCLLFFAGTGICLHEPKTGMPRDQQDHFVITSETYVFSRPQVRMQDNRAIVTLEGATSMVGQAGAPRLPVVTKTYLFPFGTHIHNVEVTYGNITQQQLPGPIETASPPQITAISAHPRGATTPSIYQKNQTFPLRPHTVTRGAGLVEGTPTVIVTVNLYPIQYQPGDRITTAGTASVTLYHTVPMQQEKPVDTYELLVLAPALYSEALQPLITYKNDHGTATMMTTLEEIPKTGLDIQESIKLYIKDALETWGITSVLLVGGGMEEGIQFPVRLAWIKSGQYEDNFPSDLYYADIYDANGSFSTWDANKNGKYAEYPEDMSAVDVYPDVYLGRLPATRVAQVSAVVNKIITYEEHHTMLHTIVQIGGDTFPDDPENINEGEYANSQVLQRLPGYEATQLWASTNTLTKKNIITGFYQGADFVDFSGHGSPLSWATHPPGNDSIWLPEKTLYSPYPGFLYMDAHWVFNMQQLPVVVLNACSCSKFTESTNTLAWSLVKKHYGGAIASYGASGIGFGSYGINETERVFGWMEVHLLEGLYQDKILGVVWGNALWEYASSFDLDMTDYKTLLEMTLFGDPTLAIEDGAHPGLGWRR